MKTQIDIPATISLLRLVGLTQSQIGEAVGLSQPTISDIESGKCGVKRPSFGLVDGLRSLAALHGVDTSPPPKRRPKPPTKPAGPP